MSHQVFRNVEIANRKSIQNCIKLPAYLASLSIQESIIFEYYVVTSLILHTEYELKLTELFELFK